MTAPSTKYWRQRYKTRIVSGTLSDTQWFWLQDYRLETGLNPSEIIREAIDLLTRKKLSTMYRVGDRHNIRVHRNEANLDRACDEAYAIALATFGVNEEGQITGVRDAPRNRSSVRVEFMKYFRVGSMGGVNHYYEFHAWVHVDKEEP